jgi:hypothetical protein
MITPGVFQVSLWGRNPLRGRSKRGSILHNRIVCRHRQLQRLFPQTQSTLLQCSESRHGNFPAKNHWSHFFKSSYRNYSGGSAKDGTCAVRTSTARSVPITPSSPGFKLRISERRTKGMSFRRQAGAGAECCLDRYWVQRNLCSYVAVSR